MHHKSIYFLLVSAAALIVLGLVILSSVAPYSKNAGALGSILQRQGQWLAIALVVCVVASRVDYHFWERTWWMWLAVAAVLLLACLPFSPVGESVKGASRWIKVGPLRFQPSDLAKMAVIIFLAFWFSRHVEAVKTAGKGFLWPALVVAAVASLIVVEVDLGTTALLFATMFIIMFIAGTRLWYLAAVAVLGVAGFGLALQKVPERMDRVLAFVYPEKYPGEFYQQREGIIAFGAGGTAGRGLGQGRQKMQFLPEAHTDFIFPMIGEELGMQVTLAVVFCYLIIILCGTMIALQAADRFGMLLGMGIVIVLALQAAVNIGVTTALLPNKGMGLPFISYGGSNLLFCLAGLGILINIWRQGVSDTAPKPVVRLNAKVCPRL